MDTVPTNIFKSILLAHNWTNLTTEGRDVICRVEYVPPRAFPQLQASSPPKIKNRRILLHGYDFSKG